MIFKKRICIIEIIESTNMYNNKMSSQDSALSLA